MLAAQVGVLQRDEIEGEVVAMLTEEAARKELVDSLESEGVRANETLDLGSKPRRVAQPPHGLRCESCAAFGMVTVGTRLAEIVEERAESDRQ